MEKGIFCLTLDTELAWGMVDQPAARTFAQAHSSLKGRVFSRLLELFERFKIKATWAMVGHLFLKEYQGENGKKHPDLVRPEYSWVKGDWLDPLPFGSTETEPFWYGRDILDLIRASPIQHEIGLHSFTHTIWGEKGFSQQAARSELAHAQKYARLAGVAPRSFVFPRNLVGCLEVLKEFGFIAFRGREDWLDNQIRLGKPYRLVKQFLKFAPPVFEPCEVLPGLWDIPASMFLPQVDAFSNWLRLPLKSRVQRAAKGVNAAVRERKVFHLWFHPHNACFETEMFFLALSNILDLVNREIDLGNLQNLTLSETAECAAQKKRIG